MVAMPRDNQPGMRLPDNKTAFAGCATIDVKKHIGPGET
jgi:hypothetical protein